MTGSESQYWNCPYEYEIATQERLVVLGFASKVTDLR
jgi:hypothetical protein